MLTIKKEEADSLGLNTDSDVFLGKKAVVPDINIDKTSWAESAKANFSLYNPIFSNLKYMDRKDYEQDDSFDVFDQSQYDLKGYEHQIEAFALAANKEEADNIKAGIQERDQYRKEIDEDGVRGFVMSMVAGTLSPENFIPAGVAITSLRVGAQAAKAGLMTAAAGGAAAALSEAALHNVQPEKTIEESAYAIAGTTLLSGILGGSFAGIKTSKFHNIAKVIEADLRRSGMDTSVGAMESALLKGEKLKVKTALGYGEIDLFDYLNMGPGSRLEINPLDSAKLAGRQLEHNPSDIRGNEDFIASPESTEILIRKWDGDVRNAMKFEDDAYYEYRKGNAESSMLMRKAISAYDFVTRNKKHMSRYEFSLEVGKAGAMDDLHPNPFVQKAAQSHRKFYDKIMEESIAVGKLPEDFKFDSITAPSWAYRIYSRNKIAARKPDVINRFVEWLKTGGSRQAEIDNILTTLKTLDPKTQGPMVDKLRKKIEKLEKSQDRLSETDLAEMQDAATTYVDRILGNEGVISRTEAIEFGKAGPFHARTLLIPDNILDDIGILERDSLMMMDKIRRRVIPEIEITKKFGDLNMSEAKRKMLDELNQKVREAKTEKERLALDKDYKQAIIDLDAIRDRLLGIYKAPKNPDSIAVRSSFGARQWAYMTHMGGMTLASAPDLGSIIAEVGLTRFVKTFSAITTSKNFRNLSLPDKRAIGVGADLWLHSRSNALYEVGDPYGKGNKLERGMKSVGENFSFFAMMDAWNSGWKMVAATAIEDRIATTVLKLAKGGISQAEITRLAAAGIDEPTARGIAEQIQKHGTKMRGVHLTNFREWDKGSEHLVSKITSAILRDTDNAIVTKGAGDAPLWMSAELGKHVAQFQNFAISANRRLVQKNLQRVGMPGVRPNDMAVYNGVMAMMAMAYLSYETRALIDGKDTSEDTIGMKVRESFDRSGIGGAIWQIPQNVNRSLGDPLWESSSKYKTRPKFSAMLGPTVGMAERVWALPSQISEDGVSDPAISTARRLIPYQNMFYLRWLFDNFEERAKE